MEKQFTLSITSDTTDINVNSTDANEVARIVQLAGLPPSVPVTQAADMSHPPAMDAVPAPISVPPPETATTDNDMEDGLSETQCSICGSNDHQETACPDMISADLEENVAEFDYGEKDNDDEGHEGDVQDYVWQGSKLPQRIVKGGQGDNPLISELYQKLTAQYSLYLEEADRENEEGVMSPLSDPTKPEFDKDPMSGEKPVDDGSRSPLSTIKRQHAFK